jgi:hypothetical protein
MEDLIGVPHSLRLSKGAGFESMERREHQNPDPFQKPRRVGHPEKLNQSLGDYLLKWYNPIVCVRQLKEAKGSATRLVTSREIRDLSQTSVWETRRVSVWRQHCEQICDWMKQQN